MLYIFIYIYTSLWHFQITRYFFLFIKPFLVYPTSYIQVAISTHLLMNELNPLVGQTGKIKQISLKENKSKVSESVLLMHKNHHFLQKLNVKLLNC
ncbi:hypothetical protein Hanom_Chr15g01409041 [Helianthus anomalus]